MVRLKSGRSSTLSFMPNAGAAERRVYANPKRWKIKEKETQMSKGQITEKVSAMLEGFLSEHELELYKVEYVKEDGERYLRVYIEKPEPAPGEPETYIGSDDCVLVSEYLSARLDEEDPIDENYVLEVSSPGMDRELIKDDDYRRFAGRKVDISLREAFEGRKGFVEVTLIGLTQAGTDGEAAGKVLVIEDTPIIPPPKKGMKPKFGETKRYEIPFSLVSKVTLSVIF